MLVFNFHHVEKRIKHPDRKHITITPEGLRNFIRTLRMLGIEIISMNEALDIWASGQASKYGRKAVLTFDDGYVNNLTEGLPILEAERCPATIFVLPGRFAGTNAWDQGHLPEDQRDALMSLDQMQQLGKSPYVVFGSHGMLHRKFPALTTEELHTELHESHRILSAYLGDAYLPIMAYPWGDYSQTVLDAMETSPYEAAFTVETAPWEQGVERFRIPRYSGFYRDGNPLVLMAKLARHGQLLN